MGSIGFKEWALVCEALGRGEQTVILRKGGIAEGRSGFEFKHGEFYLLPTFFHEQIERVRMAEAEIPRQVGGEIEVQFFARVEMAALVTEWRIAAALEPFHVLRDDVVRERFEYDGAPGIHVAFVRVFRLTPSWRFADEARFGGCRSWVQLPNVPAEPSALAVLSDEEHAARLAEFRAVLAK